MSLDQLQSESYSYSEWYPIAFSTHCCSVRFSLCCQQCRICFTGVPLSPSCWLQNSRISRWASKLVALLPCWLNLLFPYSLKSVCDRKRMSASMSCPSDKCMLHSLLSVAMSNLPFVANNVFTHSWFSVCSAHEPQTKTHLMIGKHCINFGPPSAHWVLSL